MADSASICQPSGGAPVNCRRIVRPPRRGPGAAKSGCCAAGTEIASRRGATRATPPTHTGVRPGQGVPENVVEEPVALHGDLKSAIV
jgi:hypothetical protein